MNNITKLISNKIIIIAATLSLTMTYIGLVTVYAEGLSNNLNTQTKSHGRNTPVNINDLVNQANPEEIQQIKHKLKRQLQQAEFILNIIENQEES